MSDINPIEEFAQWFAEARQTKLRYPNAMALATVDASGMPAVRIVLMKAFDSDGLVFYTNYDSAKSQAIKAHPKASVCFHWEELGRQVRVSGAVEPVTLAEADEYFASRPRDSQLGAWASLQSRTMKNRAEFETRFHDVQTRFAEIAVPRPENWSGWRIIPSRIEFWVEKPFRLHDRWVYTRQGEGWQKDLLYP